MLAGALAAYAVGIETGQPVVGRPRRGHRRRRPLDGARLSRAPARAPTRSPPVWPSRSSDWGSRRCSARATCRRASKPFTTHAIPGLSDIPFVGPILFDHDPLTYLSFVIVPAVWLWLYRTGVGLRIRAAGERPDVLDDDGHLAGTPPLARRWRSAAALAGLGGAQLATAFARTWSEDMVAGRGFIAVALVIFAGLESDADRSPVPICSPGRSAFQLELQARGAEISIFLLDAIPYVVVLVVLALLSGRRRSMPMPEALEPSSTPELDRAMTPCPSTHAATEPEVRHAYPNPAILFATCSLGAVSHRGSDADAGVTSIDPPDEAADDADEADAATPNRRTR